MTVATEITKINYNLRAGQYGGSLIFPSDWVLKKVVNTMLTMPSEEDLYTQSASQQYPIATQLKKNGRIFRYCKAGAGMGSGHQGFLKVGYFLCPGSASNNANSGFEGAVYADVAAHATSFQIADTAAAKNEYENAHFTVYNDTDACYEDHIIIGNDASNGTTTTLYIAPPGFEKAITTSYGITIYRNPYMDIRSALSVNMNYNSALGYAKLSITSGYYFWLQTAGPITGITFDSGYTAGIIAYGRDVFANTDGSLYGQAATARYYQRIGYILSRTASDYADNFIMLQLDQ